MTLWKMRKNAPPAAAARAGRQARAQLREAGSPRRPAPTRSGRGDEPGSATRPASAVRCSGLYLHIPFCSAICNYCNFNRGLFDAALKDALRRRARARDRAPAAADGRRAADTIFFGGGTPSLLEPGGDRRASSTPAATAFDVAADAEVTLEANPRRVTETGWRVPRRRRQPAQLRRPVVPRRRAAAARAAASARSRARRPSARRAPPGFDNISLDLMMWLPQQSASDWLEIVEALIALGPEHVSLYLLEVYPNAPLKEDMARAGLVAGARRRRGGDVLWGHGAARSGRVRAVRDLERRAARPSRRATT